MSTSTITREAPAEAEGRTWDPAVIVIVIATIVAALGLVAWMVATGKVELPAFLAGNKWTAPTVLAGWLWRVRWGH